MLQFHTLLLLIKYLCSDYLIVPVMTKSLKLGRDVMSFVPLREFETLISFSILKGRAILVASLLRNRVG